MVWFKVDDNLAFHRKAVAAGNAAMGLWVRAGSWCAQMLTDGFVPDHMIVTIGTPAQKQKLIAAGLWIAVDGGCRFHGWNEKGRQPTSKSVLEDREKAARRQAQHRAGTYGDQPVVPPSNGSPLELRAIQGQLSSTTSLQDGRTADGILPDADGLFPEVAQLDDTRHDVTDPVVTGLVTGVVTRTPSRPVPKEHSSASQGEPERDLFAEFWTAYPRRDDKLAAVKAWKGALKRKADPERIIAAAAAYARSQIGTERKYLKLPTTWLNAGAYDNEIYTPGLALVPDAPVLASFEEFRLAAAGPEAAALLGIAYVPRPKPPSDATPRREWQARVAVEWIDAHEAALRTALINKKRNVS